MARFNSFIPSQITVLEAGAQKSTVTGLAAEFTAMCYLYRLIFIHPITTTYHCLKLLSRAFVGIAIPPASHITLVTKIFDA